MKKILSHTIAGTMILSSTGLFASDSFFSDVKFSPRIETSYNTYQLKDAYVAGGFIGDGYAYDGANFQAIDFGLSIFKAPTHAFDISFSTDIGSAKSTNYHKYGDGPTITPDIHDFSYKKFNLAYVYKLVQLENPILNKAGIFVGYNYTDSIFSPSDQTKTQFTNQGITLGMNYGWVFGNGKHTINAVGGLSYQLGELNIDENVNADPNGFGFKVKLQYGYVFNDKFDFILSMEALRYEFDKVTLNEELGSREIEPIQYDAGIKAGLRYTF